MARVSPYFLPKNEPAQKCLILVKKVRQCMALLSDEKCVSKMPDFSEEGNALMLLKLLELCNERGIQ